MSRLTVFPLYSPSISVTVCGTPTKYSSGVALLGSPQFMYIADDSFSVIAYYC